MCELRTILNNCNENIFQIIESKAKQGRIGEIGTPVIGPAVTNAVFAATGKKCVDFQFLKKI